MHKFFFIIISKYFLSKEKMSLENKKIAIICDWIKDFWGAELVLSHMMEAFPNADIYTSIFYQEKNPLFKNRKIFTSFIQKIPLLNRSHKLALMLRPYAFESFDLSKYDIVISSSSAESKGVITKPDTLHFCYCHTPTRYFWSHYHEYLSMMEFGFLNPLAKWLMPKLVHSLRLWDFLASKRVDFFIANSQNTASRIQKYYKRESSVIYPGIETDQFFLTEKKDFYLYVGRVIPYKKFDLIVETFNKNKKPLIIVTNTKNKLQKQLEKISWPNIIWKKDVSREELRHLYAQSKAFLFPPEEDFGLVPIEAMVSGTPVIAYKKWGALETVVEGKTWIFFKTQSVRSLTNAIEQFETLSWDAELIRKHAQNFDKNIFMQNLKFFIESKL